jgi:kanamycin kinase
MTEPDFSHLAALHALGDDAIPTIVVELAGSGPVDLVWRNDLGGLTFRLDGGFLKWNPRRTGIDLEREHDRLLWISGRHPAPIVIDSGSDDDAQWLLTAALPGECAVGDTWRAR